MTTHPELGRGRYPPEKVKGRRGYEKRTCSECGQKFYVKTGHGKKLNTCSVICAEARAARARLENATKRDHETKKVLIRLKIETHKKVKQKATEKDMTVSKYLTDLVERHFKSITLP